MVYNKISGSELKKQKHNNLNNHVGLKEIDLEKCIKVLGIINSP